MNKKELSERDICTKYITPAIESAGWDVQTQVRENVHLTAGRVIVRGRMTTRGKGKFADYVLYYKPNVAIVEAKDNNHGVGDGMQQGLGYADMLDVPFDGNAKNRERVVARRRAVQQRPRRTRIGRPRALMVHG